MLVFTRHWRRTIHRQFVAAATLAAVGVCAVGVPLPSPILKAHDGRYPCENHACGCTDADSCWHHCCCMSNVEKLAWAKQAGMTPPEFVVAAAAREVGACDSTKLAGGCCSADENDHASLAEASNPIPRPAHRAAPPRGVRIVLLQAAMKCRGLTASTSLLPPSLPVEWAEFSPLVCERYESLPRGSLTYDPPSLAIATPPPDAAAG